jgi:DNA-binding FadR family transcriptional regulator
MTKQFSTIKGATRSLHLQIARDIATRILSGELSSGVIIPSEIELCHQFGVSRTALREAIKHLSSKGLLASRPKIGTRVCPRETWNLLDPQLLGWMSSLEHPERLLKEFLSLRRAIEPESSALAARNATSDQRIRLSEAFQKMVEVANGFDHSLWVDADIHFHRLIFLSSGNNFFIPFANVLQAMFVGFISHSSKEGDTCIDEHRELYDAIMAGDPKRARKADISLLDHSRHHLSEDQVA